MPKIDHTAVAVNAAGIADAFRILQRGGQDGEGRMEQITQALEGCIGVMVQIAEAGEHMERYRVRQGASPAWGGDLPYLYDVWDLIARSLWDNFGSAPVDTLVEQAIDQAVTAEPP